MKSRITSEIAKLDARSKAREDALLSNTHAASTTNAVELPLIAEDEIHLGYQCQVARIINKTDRMYADARYNWALCIRTLCTINYEHYVTLKNALNIEKATLYLNDIIKHAELAMTLLEEAKTTYKGNKQAEDITKDFIAEFKVLHDTYTKDQEAAISNRSITIETDNHAHHAEETAQTLISIRSLSPKNHEITQEIEAKFASIKKQLGEIDNLFFTLYTMRLSDQDRQKARWLEKILILHKASHAMLEDNKPSFSPSKKRRTETSNSSSSSTLFAQNATSSAIKTLNHQEDGYSSSAYEA